MKKLILLLFVIFSASVSYSQSIQKAMGTAEYQKAVEIKTEQEYNGLLAIFNRVNPDLKMDANQKVNLMKVLKRKAQDLMKVPFDEMGKREIADAYGEINEKYRMEILRSLDLEHRQAYLKWFPAKVK